MRGTNEEDRTRHAFNKLKRLLISVRDFQEALSAATFLLEEVDQSAKYSLAEIRGMSRRRVEIRSAGITG